VKNAPRGCKHALGRAKKQAISLDDSYRIKYHICIDMKYLIHNTGECAMARDGITFEQVAAAADTLAARGQQPTMGSTQNSEKIGR
jgi:hypothetical protein